MDGAGRLTMVDREGRDGDDGSRDGGDGPREEDPGPGEDDRRPDLSENVDAIDQASDGTPADPMSQMNENELRRYFQLGFDASDA